MMRGITTTSTLVSKNSRRLEGMFELTDTLRMKLVPKNHGKRERRRNLGKNEIVPYMQIFMIFGVISTHLLIIQYLVVMF